MAGNVFILGAGLSGIYSKMQNPKSTLIDKSEYLTISTRLVTVVNGDDKNYAYKLRPVDRNETVRDIDFANRLIVTDKGNIPYGKLIIALGHNQEIRTIEGSQYLHKLETIEDAISMRELIRKSENITIIGGSYLGVELASIIKGKNVTVLESGSRILARGSESASDYVSEYLKNTGVNIITGFRVKEVTQSSVLSSDNEVKSDLTVYAGGISGNPLIENLGIKSENSRIVVNRYLQSVDYDDVYACGDSMKIEDKDFPMTAFIARKSGVVAMKNATGSSIEFGDYKSGNILSLNGKYVLVRENGFSKGPINSVIKKYVNRKTEKTLEKLNQIIGNK
ncbi:MAG: FAD-dependent oxidoreductase [Ferroplasma sp.]|uniref:NAD(P)/FAD-dependent oxidoreductase n=1 Tax=Ferroplasma sp. TaxID=2591003 RepID=UPI00281501D4|nr:FAD-dependent oxidoreductase [Ferroplasma sp.]WMT50722.1 MAG: FAD-dependent oxidoreductase [Ferroplasma sp.]